MGSCRSWCDGNYINVLVKIRYGGGPLFNGGCLERILESDGGLGCYGWLTQFLLMVMPIRIQFFAGTFMDHGTNQRYDYCFFFSYSNTKFDKMRTKMHYVSVLLLRIQILMHFRIYSLHKCLVRIHCFYIWI